MDKYDKAIEILCAIENKREFEKKIMHSWVSCNSEEGTGCLFQYANNRNERFTNPEGRLIGCLTMIKQGPGRWFAWTQELTDGILADDRIPTYWDEITVENRKEVLPAFAEWQKRLDREVRNQKEEEV